jgi:hypothetical protein
LILKILKCTSGIFVFGTFKFPYKDLYLFILVMYLLGEKRNVYKLLVGKPEGKRPLGSPKRRWIDNIKMDLFEIGLSVVDWIGLAQDRYRWRALVNSVMNLRVP